MDVRNQTDNKTGSYGASKTVSLPFAGGELPVTVRSFYNGNGEYNYYVTLKKADGTEVPMRSSSKTGNGWFSSIDHLIADFDKNIQNKQLE
jgi:hypothetical protein